MTEQELERKKRKIMKEAERVMARLGAISVTMICAFRNGYGPVVLLDGGHVPMPPAMLYSQMAQYHTANAKAQAQAAKMEQELSPPASEPVPQPVPAG